MFARKITVSIFALVFALALAGFSGAADSPQAAPDAAKECCHHKSGGSEGAAHCDHHAKAKATNGKACCTKHAAKRADGAKDENCCCDSCEHSAKKAAPTKS